MIRGQRILDRYVELLTDDWTGLFALSFWKCTKLRYRCDTDFTAEWLCLRWSWLHDLMLIQHRRRCF